MKNKMKENIYRNKFKSNKMKKIINIIFFKIKNKFKIKINNKIKINR